MKIKSATVETLEKPNRISILFLIEDGKNAVIGNS